MLKRWNLTIYDFKASSFKSKLLIIYLFCIEDGRSEQINPRFFDNDTSLAVQKQTHQALSRRIKDGGIDKS